MDTLRADLAVLLAMLATLASGNVIDFLCDLLGVP